jgi:mono/diheme cytochrome c family protein
MTRIFLLLFFIGSIPWGTAQAQTGKELVAKGQYILSLAGGCACHTVTKETPYRGGRAFPIPFGTVYSTNITQDKETGLGNWTDQQIRDAMVKGIRPDGSRILPGHALRRLFRNGSRRSQSAYRIPKNLEAHKESYSSLENLGAIRPQLRDTSLLNGLWSFSNSPPQAPKSGIDIGRYLVEHVSLCGDCHTPRNFIGAPKRSLYLAGANKTIGLLGEEVSNITPDKETGIGDLKREDIVELLISGTKPDLDNVQGLMYEVIQGTPHGYKDMTKEDALAIADYLKSVPTIKNKIR